MRAPQFIGPGLMFLLFSGACSKDCSQQTYAPATNTVDLHAVAPAQSHREEKDWRGLGVATGPGFKAFNWPERLNSVGLGETVRYLNTQYSVKAQLEDVLGDKEAFIYVMRGDQQISRLYLPDGGQFGILNADTPLPVLEGWGERADGLIGRWLIVPMQDGSKLRYGISYIEVYTPDQNEALSPEAHKVQLRRNAKVLTGYFLGHATTTAPEDAQKSLQDAHKIL